MKAIKSHLTRCFVAGVAALLPIGGTIATMVYLETQIAGPWLAKQGYYFFGGGMLAAVVIIYVIGLVISTVLGRWAWGLIDRLLDSVPALGALYQTLKQILGYGEGENAVFRRAVLVPCAGIEGHEIGLVTREATQIGDATRLTVFLPGSPNPTAGRIVLVAPERVEDLDVPVGDVMKALVSIGAMAVKEQEDAA